jgi:hypothetical protein
MIDFMIIGLPRSGTTWLANLLSTSETICIHDPLYYAHYKDFDTIFQDKYPDYTTYGISCTGIWRWPQWLASHPAKKVVLHNDFESIQHSLQDMGLPPLEPEAQNALLGIDGLHVDTQEIFEDCKKMNEIWSYVTPEPFKKSRYDHLLDLHIQPNFEKIIINKEATTRLYRELASCGQL